MNDLSTLLSGLADDASRSSEPLDVARVLVHGHRRRRARQIGTGAIAACAAGALVTAGFAAPGLIGRGGTTLPGATAVSPAPDPTTSWEVPPADDESALLACGSRPEPSATGDADEIRRHLSFHVESQWHAVTAPGPSPEGETLEFSVTTRAEGTHGDFTTTLEVNEVALTTDGVVVALMPSSDAFGLFSDLPEGLGTLSNPVKPTPCDERMGWTMPSGTYGLWTAISVRTTDGNGLTLSSDQILEPDEVMIGGSTD